MTSLKQSRWTKIHEQGEANFEPKNNIMDITVGADRCQAEAVFTSTSTYAKAAYWPIRFLGHADAEQIIALAAEEIQNRAANASRTDGKVEANGENWACIIEKLDKGVFKVQMNWAVRTDELKGFERA